MAPESASDMMRPSVPVLAQEGALTPHRGGTVPRRAQDQLIADTEELHIILVEIERLKRLAKSPEDWRVVMMFIATQKPRLSEMTARSKRIYAQEFGDAYEAQYQDLGAQEKAPSARTAEIRAKKQAGIAYEVADRLERTWKDLEALMWACKDVAANMDMERKTPAFDAYPDHMFPAPDRSPQSHPMAMDTSIED